jgi:hypothetical protein
MGELFATIRQLVSDERYVVGLHAAERLDERGILEWQAVVGLANGRLIAERASARPNPSVEVQETLPDGTDIIAVWSLLERSDVAKLVTVFYSDEE